MTTCSRIDRAAARVAEAIEMTRFPVPQKAGAASASLEPKPVQAADFIGQLGDPMYMRKASALYYEFEEIGTNRQLGIRRPPILSTGIPPFLELCAERAQRLMGPQS